MKPLVGGTQVSNLSPLDQQRMQEIQLVEDKILEFRYKGRPLDVAEYDKVKGAKIQEEKVNEHLINYFNFITNPKLKNDYEIIKKKIFIIYPSITKIYQFELLEEDNLTLEAINNFKSKIDRQFD
jgi:hypothetical protein